MSDKPIYALSIKQPYGWLVCKNYKDIENRDWSLNKFLPKDCLLPVRIYIHVGISKSEITEEVLDFVKKTLTPEQKAEYKGRTWDSILTFGAIIGETTITGQVTKSESPWFFGIYGFTVKGGVLYDKPIPCRGQLGFFKPKFGGFKMTDMICPKAKECKEKHPNGCAQKHDRPHEYKESCGDGCEASGFKGSYCVEVPVPPTTKPELLSEGKLRQKLIEKLCGFNPEFDSVIETTDSILSLCQQQEQERIGEAVSAKSIIYARAGDKAHEDFIRNTSVSQFKVLKAKYGGQK